MAEENGATEPAAPKKTKRVKAEATNGAAAPKKTKTPKADKPAASADEKRRGAPAGPRAAPEGFVALSTLAGELGKSTSILRRKLRASGVEVEGRFWAWKEGSKDLKQVRELLAG